MKLTVEGNVIESTTEPPTQWVRIEETHSIQEPPKPKKGEPPSTEKPEVVRLANDNRIIDNKLKGHQTADIIVRGPDTVVEGNIGKVIEERRGLGPVLDY